MHPANAYPRIVTDESMMETVSHGTVDFPFQYYLENIWEFDFHAVDWHWHPEIEILFVRKGSVRCLIGSEILELHRGEGMLINSHVIHRFETSSPNLIPNAVFSPTLLAPQESLIYRQYIQPVLLSLGSFQFLSPEVDWQAEVLRLMETVFQAQETEVPNRLKTLYLLLVMWSILHEHADHPSTEAADQDNSVRLQRMMSYIHERYNEPITLDDIAASVYIGKSRAMQLFRSDLHTSPIAYLVQYRLKRAAKLLASTEKQVSAIAEETGFQSTGYFCRRFRELFGMSPVEYRLHARER